MCQWTRSSLVQVMAWHLIGAKPLPGPILTCQLGPKHVDCKTAFRWIMMASSNGNIFPGYWPFVWGIHRSPVNSPFKGQWHGALMFSLICIWINDWVNKHEAGNSRRYRAHYDVIVLATALHWWEINIASGNGLVLSGAKSLPEPKLKKVLWCHSSLGHNELTPILWNMWHSWYLHIHFCMPCAFTKYSLPATRTILSLSSIFVWLFSCFNLLLCCVAGLTRWGRELFYEALPST